MTNRKRPRVDWEKLSSTAGTAKMLMDAASITPDQGQQQPTIPAARQFVEARLKVGDDIQIAGLTVRITGVHRRDSRVSITGTALRQVEK